MAHVTEFWHPHEETKIEFLPFSFGLIMAIGSIRLLTQPMGELSLTVSVISLSIFLCLSDVQKFNWPLDTTGNGFLSFYISLHLACTLTLPFITHQM